MSESTPSAADRTRAIRFVLWAILAANWTVALAKTIYGLATHSTAMTADGLHSFIDGASNVVGLVAMYFAGEPADEQHPYGHQKFEALAALAIGVMIGVAVLELGRMAFEAIAHGVRPTAGLASFLVMAASVVINVTAAAVERREGRKLKSPLLLADAQHNLSDLFVSGAVVVSLALSWAGVDRADGLVSVVVLVFVAKAGWEIVSQAAGILADSKQLDPTGVRSVAAGIQGVVQVRDVRSRGMHGAVYVDLKITVEPSLTVAAAHQVSDGVEQALQVAFPEVIDVVVHVEPEERRP